MRDISELLSYFPNHKKVGNHYEACCPACDDTKHHLYITPADDKALLYCQKCQKSTTEIISAVGLKLQDLFFGENGNANIKPVSRREHIYYNADGSIFGKKDIVSKTNGEKDCYWSRYENGSYKHGLKGQKAPLYNLPLLTKTNESTIYFAEGEKDCETLRSVGLVATTTPNGGHQKEWLNSFSDCLVGKNIVVLTDNDSTGVGYGLFVAKNTFPVAESVRIVPSIAIFPTIGEKGDITDICHEIGTEAAIEALKRAVAKACVFEPEKPKSILEECGFYELDDLTEDEKKPPDFIVDGMIPVGLSFLSGAPKIRKSFMALQLAAAVATGQEFLGYKTTKCCVAYFDLEGSKSRISARTDRMKSVLPRGVYITHRVDEKISDGLIEKIRSLHQQNPEIRLYIIDTYSRARGSVKTGGANAYDSDVQLLEPVQRMAIEQNISVLFVHHDKKGAGFVTDSFERLSGTMGISGSADSVLNLVADGKRFDGKATLEFNPRDAKGGEIKLTFDEYCFEWEMLAPTNANLYDNPVIRWCIDKAPDRGKDAEFFKYEDIYLQIFHTRTDNAGAKIRGDLAEHRNEIYSEYGVAIQMGVKSHGERGIRLLRAF